MAKFTKLQSAYKEFPGVWIDLGQIVTFTPCTDMYHGYHGSDLEGCSFITLTDKQTYALDQASTKLVKEYVEAPTKFKEES